MCAAQAGYRGRSVLVLDNAKKPGRKILISGGGATSPTIRPAPRLPLGQPHFCKSALARYTQQDFIDLVDRHGLSYHEKTLGQLFCDESAKEIVDILLTECDWAGVALQFQTEILAVSKSDEGFVLTTSQGRSAATRWWWPPAASPCRNSAPPLRLQAGGAVRPQGVADPRRAGALYPASGRERGLRRSGRGQPAGGGDRRGWHLFQGGHAVHPSRPLRPGHPADLFVLAGGEKIHINLLPELDIAATLREWAQAHPAQELKTVLGRELPKRFVDKLVELGQLVSKPMRQYNERELEAVATLLGIGRSCPTAPRVIAPPK